MHQAIAFLLLMVCWIIHFTEGTADDWRWQADTSVCFNQSENATMSWRVTLDSGESILNVQIDRVKNLVSQKMIDKTGPLSNRQVTLYYDKLFNVTHEVIFTLVVNNTLDGFGTWYMKAIVVTMPNAKIYNEGKQIPLRVQVPIHNFVVPSSITTSEFGSANLTCSADGTPTPTIRWTDQHGQTLSQSHVHTLTNVTRSMSGAYTCIATDGCGANYTRSTSLVVQYKPENTALTVNSTSVCQGKAVQLTCNASASPPANNYTFKRNGNTISSCQSGPNCSLTATEGGVMNLTCEASNTVGTGVSQSVPVTVNVPIYNFTGPDNATANEFSTVNLSCSAEGYPNPTIRWTKDGTHVTDGHVLSFRNVTRDKSGRYTCTAIDSTGCGQNYTNTAFLNVHYKPEHTNLTKVQPSGSTICKNSNISLRCETYANPMVSLYTFYNNGTMLATQASQSYTLKAANPGVNQLTCNTTNIVGSDVSPPILVNVYEPISNFTGPTNITVNESAAIDLHCSADGYPVPSVSLTNPQGQIVSRGSVYSVVNIVRNMSGEYRCTAVDTSGCGANFTKSSFLVVQYKPENVQLTNTQPSGSTICLNGTISLICSASASPAVSSYTFYNHGNHLVTQSRGVYNLTARNTGTYNVTCVAKNAAGFSASSSVVTVTVNAPITNFTGPSNITLNESSSVDLPCSADGYPVPLVSLISPQGQIMSRGSVYSLVNISRNMSGEFRCTAVDTSGCGTNVTQSAFIVVQYKPENIQLSKIHPVGSTLCQGDTISLLCSASGNPAVSNYIFYNHGNHVMTQPSGSYNFSAEIPGSNSITCMAGNAVGVSTISSVVTVTVDVPTSTINVSSTTTVNEFGYVTLSCSADGTPAPSIRWTDQHGQTLNQSSVYTLVNVTRDMHGRIFTCNVTDACGKNHTNSTSLVVNYKPENTQLIKVSPSGSTVCREVDITVSCSASARPPVSSFTLYKDGVNVTTQGHGTFTTRAIINGTTNGIIDLVCEPANDAGTGKNASLSISVNEPPFNVSVQSSPANYTVQESSNLTLTCAVSGAEPENTVTTWSKDGKILAGKTERSLTLTRVLRINNGSYNCTVTDTSNTCGAVSGSIAITVQYLSIDKEVKCIGEGETSINVTVTSFPKATFSCKVGDEPLTTQEIQTSHANDRIAVYSVSWSTGSEVTTVACQARNSIGESNYTYSVKRTTGKSKTSSGSFTLPKEECPPSDETKNRISRMVHQSVDASCFMNITLSYSCGSLNVSLRMTTTSDIENPFFDLKEALIQNARLHGFTIDPDSFSFKMEGPSTEPRKGEGLSEVEIALIAVGAVLFFLILFIVVYCICNKKKKKSKAKRSENVEMSLDHHYARNGPAATNGGVEDPYSEVLPREPARPNNDTLPYAQVGGQREQQGSSLQVESDQRVPDITYAEVNKKKKKKAKAGQEPTYAEVDKTKEDIKFQKSRKKKPGELLYADLQDFTDGKPRKAGGLEFGPGQGVKRPEQYQETDYAEISHVLKGKGNEEAEKKAPIGLVLPPGPPVLNIKNVDVKDTTIRLSWTSPLNDGNNPIIDYKVEVGDLCLEKISSNSIVMPELTPNTTYLVKVYARNEAGCGTPASKAVTTRKEGNIEANLGAAYSNEAYQQDPNEERSAAI